MECGIHIHVIHKFVVFPKANLKEKTGNKCVMKGEYTTHFLGVMSLARNIYLHFLRAIYPFRYGYIFIDYTFIN